MRSIEKTHELFHDVVLSLFSVEGVSEEEEVDDQLLWNLQILSEVDNY